VSRLHKLIMTALAAVIFASLMAAPAAAVRRVEVSTTEVLVLIRELRFTGEESGALISCDVTLHITLLRLIEKVRLSHAGSITAILTANPRSSLGGTTTCLGLRGLPVLYDSIRGTLPDITGATLWVGETTLEGRTRQGFLISLRIPFVGEVRCLYAGLIRVLLPENRPAGRTNIDETASRVSLAVDLRGSIACDRTGRLEDDGNLGVIRPTISILLLE
jgi:hypothetical protein